MRIIESGEVVETKDVPLLWSSFGDIVKLDDNELKENYKKYRGCTYYITSFCGGSYKFEVDDEGLGEYINYDGLWGFANISELRKEKAMKKFNISEKDYYDMYNHYDKYRSKCWNEPEPDKEILNKLRG